MAVYCPACGQQFDVALFQFGSIVVCDCGAVVGEEIGALDGEAEASARQEQREIQRMADRVCAAILGGGCTEAELDAAIEQMREEVLARYPHRADLFTMIYASRFARLREQFPPRA
jgi:transcription initiation factor TFIIIB Brf1 subunit/transcription initiation factor TFIIB